MRAPTAVALAVPHPPALLEPRAATRRLARGLWRPLLVLAAGVVVGDLLVRLAGGLGAAVSSLAAADLRWLLLAAVAATGSYLAAGVALHGAVSRTVPLGRLVALQLACAFTNRLLPAGIGAMATNVRGLRRWGTSAAQARLAVATTAVTGVCMHVVTVVLALPFLLTLPAARPLTNSLLNQHPVVLAAPVVLVPAVALLLRRPLLVRTVGRRLGVDLAWLRTLAAHPQDLGLLMGGSLGITTCHAVAFVAALHAVGLAMSLPTALSLYVTAIAVAGLVPTPGGVGGVDAALLIGLAALGAATAPAAAAVLVFRLLTFWLPTLPGLFALIWTMRRGWL